MMISSHCKRMMACMITIAMVLSMIFIVDAPQTKAADVNPSVSVLGATIRLNAERTDTNGQAIDNNGKQSMMIGVQVNNANKASACAITLTVGDVSYTVATDSAKIGGNGVTQTTLHSKDTDSRSIIYAVVVTNIPESAYYSTIGILGKAWDMDDNLYTSSPAEKNVMGVVATIQSKFPALNIRMVDGSLYKNYGAELLTAADLSGYSSDPDPEMTSNPVITPTPVPAANTYVVDFSDTDVVIMPSDASLQGYSIVFDATGGGHDLIMNLPAEEVVKRYTKVTVNYEHNGGTFAFKYHKLGAGNHGTDDYRWGTGSDFKLSSGSTSKTINLESEYYPVDRFVIFDWFEAGSLTINSVVFSDPKPDYSGNVDLSAVTVDDIAIANSAVASYENNVITVNDSEGSTELLFPLPNSGTIDNGEAVSVVVEGTCTVPDFAGFRVRLAHGSSGGDSSWSGSFIPTQSRTFKEVFALTATSANATEIAIKSISANSDPISGLTISNVSVYWTGRDAVAPTAMPSPTPVPTATPEPTATPVPTAVPSAKTYAIQVPDGSSITIDGNVDAVWDNAIEYPFLYYSNGRVRNSSEATIKYMWDEDYIYGLYDVYDAYIDESHDNAWNRDGVEIFFDEDNSKEAGYGGSDSANTDAFQYRVSGLATDVTSPLTNEFSHNTSATATLYSGLTVSTASNGCGYRVEFKIPVAQANNLGRVVGLDATVMDAQDGTRNNEMWYSAQKSGSMYSDASLFENVKLIATKPSVPVNTPDPAQPADCLAYFTFDNSSRDGYVYSSTDGNAKATVIGSIDSVSTDAISGESLYKAKGNPSYVKLENADGSSILDGLNNVTISYWSYVPDAYDSNAVNYGWGFYAGRNGISLGTSNRYYLALIDRSNKYRLDMAKSGGGGNNVDNIAKTEGSWNNVTVVVNGTTSTVYVNGVQQATLSGLTLSEALGTNSKFYIGIRPWAQGDGAEYFQGYIDDFAVFGRAFSASEVADYVGAVTVPTPAPTATPTPTPSPTPSVADTELDPANLVTNGNFANGKTGWGQNGGSTSAEVVDYSNCLLNSSRYNNFSGPQTTITGTFNQGDVLTYQYKIKRAKTLDDYNRYFIIKFKESSTEHQSDPTSSSDGSGTVKSDAEHWVTYYGSYTVQEATSSIVVVVMESGGYKDYGASGVVRSDYDFYIDDVQIVRTYAATPTPMPTATPEPATWNDNYEVMAEYELYTPSGAEDINMLGKEVIFTGMADNGDVYALSVDGTTVTATNITDMYFGDTLYIPTNYDLDNISWFTMWNKADNTSTPDSGKGYMFQNAEDLTYLGIWGTELSSQGMPDGYTSGNIDYKVRFTWTGLLHPNYKTANALIFDGSGFVGTAGNTNVRCYVKSYAGDYARKNTWHKVDHFTSGREYLICSTDAVGTTKAFNMTGTGSSSFATKDLTVNSDGSITYTADYNDSAVVNAHSLSDGTFYLDTWYCPTTRHTLSYNGNTKTKWYVTSEHSLQNYTFRFVYDSGVLKGYYGLSGTGTEMDVKYAGGSTYFGTTGSDVFIFERDL